MSIIARQEPQDSLNPKLLLEPCVQVGKSDNDLFKIYIWSSPVFTHFN